MKNNEYEETEEDPFADPDLILLFYVDTQWADSRYVSIKRTDDQYALEYMNE